MINLNFETLDPIKLPLVQRFYKNNYPSSKPKKDETIIIGRHQSTIVAAIRFRHIENHTLLTGMCVEHSMRTQGLGHKILSFCEENVLSESVYCFAFSHLVDFYSKHGFCEVSSENLPNSFKLLYSRYTQHGKQLIPMRYL